MKNIPVTKFLNLLEKTPILEEHKKIYVLKKGEHIFKQGDVCNEVFCLNKGLLKLYYNTVEGKEWIKSFIVDSGILGSRNSMLLDKPSTFNVVCLEKSEIISYPYKVFEEICSNNQYLSTQLFNFMQWVGLKKELREYQLLCLSAEEAYRDFVESSPELVSRLTQIDIARYLGITPIALSRIKKRNT